MDMKEQIGKEMEQLLLLGRGLSPSDFEDKFNVYFDGKSEEEQKVVTAVFQEIQLSKLQEYKEVTKEISVLKQLNGIEKLINLSKISEIYFGKTKSWIFQRLHEYTVHGKPVKFTEDEKKTLSKALLDLSENIKSVALDIA